MKKKIIIIICIIIILGVILAFVFNNIKKNDKKVGPLDSNYFEVNEYAVEINSKKSGHPSEDAYFNTSFEIKDNKNYENTYEVDVIELYEKENENDIASTVNINGKEFYYFIDEENHYAILEYYTIVSNKSVVLKIKITGMDSFDEKGNLTNVTPTVNAEVLKSQELASILNLSISLKK